MFVYKTDAQLEAMSAAQRDTYATEKRAYEADLLKEAIRVANESLKESMTAAQKTEIENQIKGLNLQQGITKEQYDELKEDIRIIKENPSAVNGKGQFDMMAAIEEGLKTFLPQVKEKSQASGNNGFELEMTVKSPINMTTGSVTGAVATPISYVAQDQTTYAEDVRQQEYILNYISRGNTGKATIAYVDKSPTEGTMTITAEGALKPLISIS